MTLPGQELPNDPDDNPCFGCGPRNPVGLRMRFFDDGKVTRSELTLDDRYSGWPGAVISNLVLLAIDEVLTWGAWARSGELATDDGDPTWTFEGRVRTGAPFTVEGWPGERDGPWTWFHARVLQDGEERATYRVRVRPRTRAENEELLKRPGLPRSIREDAEQALRKPG
jgi:hypothetical protein